MTHWIFTMLEQATEGLWLRLPSAKLDRVPENKVSIESYRGYKLRRDSPLKCRHLILSKNGKDLHKYDFHGFAKSNSGKYEFYIFEITSVDDGQFQDIQWIPYPIGNESLIESNAELLGRAELDNGGVTLDSDEVMFLTQHGLKQLSVEYEDVVCEFSSSLFSKEGLQLLQWTFKKPIFRESNSSKTMAELLFLKEAYQNKGWEYGTLV